MKTLLLAHDFNATSEIALDTAIELARKLSAKIVVAHVYSVPVYSFPEGSSLIPSAEDAARIGDAAQRSLDQVLERRRATPGVEISGVLRAGVPDEEICRLADEIGADMIVIGTHARGAVARALLGSVAQRVVRSAKVPVLSIRAPQPA
ncbi:MULTISPECIES: universal stress protein [Sorangium]|uniref:Universal stress protein n=1 Tax=Sorangium cellulosum (strain So ce56) TaxID=448385 RepID=A9EYM8_SORC5|nr:universal stress protein [Sorangium cellulosum]CAN97558.1 universal stress protein [Sorangium cellulosum So ce56]